MFKKRLERVSIAKRVMINGITPAEGLDLSETGMYIYTRSVIIPGNIVQVHFYLGEEPVEVHAMVQHSQPGIGIGVRFVDVPEETMQKIRNFIQVKNFISDKEKKPEE